MDRIHTQPFLFYSTRNIDNIKREGGIAISKILCSGHAGFAWLHFHITMPSSNPIWWCHLFLNAVLPNGGFEASEKATPKM